jgi:SAM-dependent methyltransferase
MIRPLHLPCPICNGPFSHCRHDWLFKCSVCGLLASDLEPKIPTRATPTALDEKRRTHGLSDIRARNNNIVLNCIQSILQRRPKRLLDVGSGLGFFLKDAAKHGFDVSGIEPDANVVEHSRNTGLQVRCGYFPDCLEKEEIFDIIVFNDVLEHIPNLTETLEACITHLGPGGLLVLNCPNRRGTFYRLADLLDRIQIHGPFDRLWQRDLPSPHLWYFESVDLRRLGERHGLVFTAKLDLLPLTFRGIFHRVFYVRNQSIITGYAGLVGTLLLMPFLALLPRDIGVVMLRKKQQ